MEFRISSCSSNWSSAWRIGGHPGTEHGHCLRVERRGIPQDEPRGAPRTAIRIGMADVFRSRSGVPSVQRGRASASRLRLHRSTGRAYSSGPHTSSPSHAAVRRGERASRTPSRSADRTNSSVIGRRPASAGRTDRAHRCLRESPGAARRSTDMLVVEIRTVHELHPVEQTFVERSRNRREPSRPRDPEARVT